MGECTGENNKWILSAYQYLSLVALLPIGQTITTMGSGQWAVLAWTQTMNLHTKLLNTQQRREGEGGEGGPNVLKMILILRD